MQISHEEARDAMEVAKLALSAASFLRRRSAELEASEEAMVGHRIRIKADLMNHLALGIAEGAVPEVYVIDIGRIEEMEVPDEKFRFSGLSPMVKAGANRIIDQGLELHRGWHQVQVRGRRARFKRGAEGMKVTGIIPYGAIIDVDWRGDASEGLPLVYCRFNQKYGPYSEERLYLTEDGQPLPPVKFPTRRPPWELPGEYLRLRKAQREHRQFRRQFEEQRRRLADAARQDAGPQ